MPDKTYQVKVDVKGAKKFGKKIKYAAECLDRLSDALDRNTESMIRNEEQWQKANFKEE